MSPWTVRYTRLAVLGCGWWMCLRLNAAELRVQDLIDANESALGLVRTIDLTFETGYQLSVGTPEE